MIFIFFAFLLLTYFLGNTAYNQKKDERNLIVTGGITLAVLATILTIISAIITIIIGLFVLFDDYLWWIF